MRKLYTTLLIVLITTHNKQANAQNLVLNPSFENLNITCTGGTGNATYLNLLNWYNPDNTDTCSTPDFYSTCLNSTNALHAPNSIIGYQYPRTGNSYAAFIGYQAFSNPYREYVEGELLSPLVANQQYCVTFYVSRADNAPYAIDKIGVYFSDTITRFPISHCISTVPIPVKPQLQYTGGIVTDTANWLPMQWTYTALGGEKYFTIGNFFDNTNTTATQIGGGIFPFAYYFIDDINIESSATANCSVNVNEQLLENSITLSPNPATNELTLQSEQSSIKEIKIINVLGECVLLPPPSLKGGGKGVVVDVSTLPKGIYFVQVTVDSAGSPTDKTIVNKKVVIQ